VSATHPSEYVGSGHRELLSEHGQIKLLLVAMAFFSVSIAIALAFTDARVHRSSVLIQGWHDVRIERVTEAAPARSVAGAHATTLSPSSPTTSA
jgi:hypothetical protein